MKVAQQRNLFRWLHIIAGSIIATYIYSPWAEISLFQILTKFVVIPLLILTGMWLWKGHLLRRMMKNKSN